MSQQLIDALLFLGLGAFWLVLTIFPYPLFFMWHTEQQRLDQNWKPSPKALQRIRRVTTVIAVGMFGLALYMYLI